MLTFEYITQNGSVAFSEDSDFWISDIDSLSSNEISISETQGTGQIGSTRSAQSVQPRDLTVTGVLFGDLKANRRSLLACVSPLTPARFVPVSYTHLDVYKRQVQGRKVFGTMVSKGQTLYIKRIETAVSGG